MSRRNVGAGARALASIVFFFAVAVHTPLAAQRRDSVVTDTTRQDTTKVVADSIVPPRIIVKHALGTRPGFGTAVWEWDRARLLLEGAITLTDLMNQVPGVTTFRTGLFLAPEITSTYGQTRGGLQIFVDGYEIDPLYASSNDLAQIPLAQLDRVRIERRLDVTRIDLTTLEPEDGRPHSRIEAGVGEPDVNLFRGLFLAPRLFFGPFGFAIDRVDTDGFNSREQADIFNAWVKWAYIRGNAGIQAEMLQSSFNRTGETPWPAEIARRDLIVRARAPIIAGLVGELFAGRTTFDNDTTDEAELPDSVVVSNPNASVTQWGARASLQTSYVWVEASARFRDHKALPSAQVDATVGSQPSRYGAVALSITQASWRGAGSALSYDVRAESPTFMGLSAFAELAGGKRGAPSAYFFNADSTRLTERKGTRFGASLSRWGGFVSAALVTLDLDSVSSFGLPFDTTDFVFRGGDPKLWEISWNAPLLTRTITAYGHFSNVLSGTVSPYMPNQLWRAGLQLHALPLRSGNLELLGRIEMRRRGTLVAPARTGTPPQWNADQPLSYFDQVDGYFQLRIMDVRLFIRAENMTDQQMFEIPGRTIDTPRFLYGVKWSFWN